MAAMSAPSAAEKLRHLGIAGDDAEAVEAEEAVARAVATFRSLTGRLREGAKPETFASIFDAMSHALRRDRGSRKPSEDPSPEAEDIEADFTATLDRAARVQEQFNAFIEITADAARAHAARLDPKRPAPLSGRFFVHKDVFVTGDRLPTAGVGHSHRWHGPQSTTIKALEAAGAITVGAANLDPWCYVPLGLNAFFGRVLHPLGGDLLTGGSSSGSAVAIATGVVDFALGTDTGGSVRLPAALCGVFGLKTTHGLILDQGLVPLSPSQDSIGILGRDLEIISSVLHVLAPDLPGESAADGRSVAAPLSGLRVGVDRAMMADVDLEIARVLDETLARLRALGASVSEVSLPALDAVNAAAAIVTGAEAGAIHVERLATRPEWFPAMIRQRLLVGLLYETGDYHEALRLRPAYLTEVLNGPFAEADFMLAPVLAKVAPRLADVEGDVASAALVAGFLRFNRPVNFLGLPAVAIPSGRSRSGAPIGLQLIGRPYADATLLGLARHLAADER